MGPSRTSCPMKAAAEGFSIWSAGWSVAANPEGSSDRCPPVLKGGVRSPAQSIYIERGSSGTQAGLVNAEYIFELLNNIVAFCSPICDNKRT